MSIFVDWIDFWEYWALHFRSKRNQKWENKRHQNRAWKYAFLPLSLSLSLSLSLRNNIFSHKTIESIICFEDDDRQIFADNLYERTKDFILILLDIVKSKITGQNVDHVIKVLIRLYQILHLFTRDVQILSFSHASFLNFLKCVFDVLRSVLVNYQSIVPIKNISFSSSCLCSKT
jgi:hypothetical protein